MLGRHMSHMVVATVLFTDIVGSTEQALALGDERWGELVDRHHAAVRMELKRFDGFELDHVGDGFLASFDAPSQAVRCAAVLVDVMGAAGLAIRAGVHTGECTRTDGQLRGAAIQISPRVCAHAGPSEVLVSSTVHDLLAGSELDFVDQGPQALQGVPGVLRLYSVNLTRHVGGLPVRVQLCGHLVIELQGRRVEGNLPGRQGEVLFAYLTANRPRPVRRDELIDALWPSGAPDGADSALSALLSKLRRALRPHPVEGRSDLQLRLPARSWIDLEAAMEAIHRAESALMRQDWTAAWGAARVTLHIARRPFLSGSDAPWIDDQRRRLSDMYIRSLETTAAAAIAIGGTELHTAERSARTLIEEATYRESGYRLLMEAMARGDNIGEALQVYEVLRRRLRDELGAAPSPAMRERHRQLLG
jgi:DNA-binding SARP family transcriptional activator/class 3 adenylate cyclase